MSDYESLREDAKREQWYEEHGEDCPYRDPYCANNPGARGTYEHHAGYLCGGCEEAQEADDIAKRTVPMGTVCSTCGTAHKGAYCP